MDDIDIVIVTCKWHTSVQKYMYLDWSTNLQPVGDVIIRTIKQPVS